MYKTIFKILYFIIWCHRKNANQRMFSSSNCEMVMKRAKITMRNLHKQETEQKRSQKRRKILHLTPKRG